MLFLNIFRLKFLIKMTFTVDVIKSINSNFEEGVLQRECSLLEIEMDCLYKPFGLLSGGQQTKVMLVALFLKDNGFLLIDESTNHLDKYTRNILGKYLKTKSGFILVSHDKEFLDCCVTHIMSINKANIEIQRGNFSSYLTNKNLQDSFEIDTNQKLQYQIDNLKSSQSRTYIWAQRGHRESKGKNSKNSDRIAGYKEYHRNKVAKLESQVKQFESKIAKSIEGKSKLLKNIEKTVNAIGRARQ